MKQIFNPEIWLSERKPFNPEQWLTSPSAKKSGKPPIKYYTGLSKFEEVDIVLRRIEFYSRDITGTYEDWIKLGFAFASEFGEAGRNYFHRISHFYSGYNWAECNRQFNNCLKGKKTGTTIKTFYAFARDAGINIKV